MKESDCGRIVGHNVVKLYLEAGQHHLGAQRQTSRQHRQRASRNRTHTHGHQDANNERIRRHQEAST